MKKYYDLLGLQEGASYEEIQEAYDRLSVDLHPSNNDNLDFFIEEYAKLKKAYSKLLEITPKTVSNANIENEEPSDNEGITLDSTTIKNLYSARYPFKEDSTITENECDNNDNVDSDKNPENSDRPNPNKSKPSNRKFFKHALISFISIFLIGIIVYLVDNNLKTKKADAFYKTAYYNYSNGRYDKALEYLDYALDKKTNYIKAHSLKGDVYMKKSSFLNATNSYKKVRVINKSYDSINYKIGYSLIANKKIKDGTLYLEYFVAEKSSSNKKKLEIIRGLIRDFKKGDQISQYLALAYCNFIIEKSQNINNSILLLDDINDAFFQRGIVYYNLNEYQLAINNYDVSIKANYSLSSSYFNRGLSYYQLDKESLALLDYNKAIELNSSKALFYRARGNNYYWMKDYLKAYEDYEKSIELGYTSSDLISSYYNKAKEEYDKEQDKIRRESWSYKKRARYNKLKLGQYYKGGIIFDLPSNYKVKILATTTTSKKLTYYKAKSKCDDLTLNGYSDWRIPSQSEIYKISDNYYTVNRGLRNSDVYYKSLNHTGFYWSSNYYGNDITDFTKGYGYISYRLEKTDDGSYYFKGQKNDPKQLVRAVREHTFK